MKIYDQIDVNNYVLETSNQDHHKFYKEQNHCCLCGHELEIRVSKKIGDQSLDEKAFCPSCNQNIILKKHSIQ